MPFSIPQGHLLRLHFYLKCSKRHLRIKGTVFGLASKKEVGFVLFWRARGVERYVARSSVGRYQIFAHEVALHFLAADIGKHLSVNFYAWRKRLATLLLHFPPKRWVLDDVLFLVWQTILG